MLHALYLLSLKVTISYLTKQIIQGNSHHNSRQHDKHRKHAFLDRNNLNVVTSFNPIPPTVNANTFGYYSATLKVPIGSKTAYQNADYQKNYTNIVEVDPSSVQFITFDKDANGHIYDLNGRKMKEPSKGINILSGKKILIKQEKTGINQEVKTVRAMGYR